MLKTRYVLPARLALLLVGLSAARLLAASAPDSTNPYQLGDVSVTPAATYSYAFVTGQLSSPGHPSDTSTQTFAGSLAGKLGSHLAFQYAPTWTMYSSGDFHDAFGQSASLTGDRTYDKWGIGVGESFSSADTPTVETGRQTPDQTLASSLQISHQIGDHFQVGAIFGETSTSDGATPGERAWSNQESFHYVASSKLDLSLGAGLSYMDAIRVSRLIAVSPQVQLQWKPSDRVTATIHGGFTNQTYLHGGKGSTRGFTGGAAAGYQNDYGTSLSLSANQTLSYAPLTDQVSKVIAYSVTLSQRLLTHYAFNGSIGQSQTKLQATQALHEAARKDTALNYSLGFSIPTLLRRLSLSVAYGSSRDDSTLAGFTQAPTQWSLTVGYRY